MGMYILYVVNVLNFFINITIWRFFLDSIQSLENPGGRHICLGYL
jgi:hypothetical protein